MSLTRLKTLVGSGDRIALLTLPFVIVGLTLNAIRPSPFRVGGPSAAIVVLSILLLVPGLTIWIWSVVLILTRVPKRELITTGPYSLVKHPLYTGVGLLVIPAVGLLLNSWLGVVIGVVLYVSSRVFAPGEEKALSRSFGPAWDEYRNRVRIPWL